MKPDLVVKKTIWSGKKNLFLGFFLALLITAAIVLVIMYLSAENDYKNKVIIGLAISYVIPFFVIILKIWDIKKESIEFYKNKVIIREGIISKTEKNSALTKIMSVSIKQSIWGRICNYGDVFVDVVGKWDVDLKYVSKPKRISDYLNTIIADTDYNQMRQVVSEE